MTPDEFVKTVAPAAVLSMKHTGIPASFTIAQGALESGWGTYAPGNNLFGIKADKSWTGPVTSQLTHEDVPGGGRVVITANFRAYPDWQGCMDDHAKFFQVNKRYSSTCFKTPPLNGEQFAQAVADADYATDTHYAQKLIATMRSHNLKQYDTL